MSDGIGLHKTGLLDIPKVGANGFEISLALIFAHITALKFGLHLI
jgi:hypothetical protein